MTPLEIAQDLRDTLTVRQQQAFDQLARSRRDLGQEGKVIWAASVVRQALEAGDAFENWDLTQLQGVT